MNRRLGLRTCAPLGGAMPVAYTPDSFGHVAQLPLLVAGFGLKGVVFERGVGDEGERLGTEFRWEAADGATEVCAVHLIGTYSTATALGHRDWGYRDAYDPDRAVGQMRAALFGPEAGAADFPTWLRANSSGKFQLSDSGWGGGNDAGNFYELLYSQNTSPGPNSGAFANADYDRAFEAARLMPDGPERIALFKTMNAIILDEVPTVLGSNAMSVGITQKWLRNFKRGVGTFELPYLDVDMVAKRKGLR